MLGRFLELALVTDDTGLAWQRWQSLGFAAAETGDIWNHAYGVVACRELAIGFHERGDEPLRLVFVRPDVAGLHRELAARDVVIEAAKLGSDAFNELTLREPGGTALRVIEARTFSPPAELPVAARVGTPTLLSLPCRDLDDAAAFCTRLGMLAEHREAPWECLALPGTPLAWHAARVLAEPAIVFDGTGAEVEEAIEAGGLRRERALRLASCQPHQRLRTDEDLTLVVLADG